MISLIMKQNQIHGHREQTCGCQGREVIGEGCAGSLGFEDTN